jgi:hypothetical protein
MERRGLPRREGEGRREDGRRSGSRENRSNREVVPRLNVKVAFLPDRERLALVVRDIQVSRRAFPLIEIANRFLGREDLYLVKLELPPPAEGQPRQTFVQCLDCRRVFRTRANAEAHVLNGHLHTFFDIEEIETEPPSGAFTCVARCRLSHVLLGPPNYHGYNEKIQELWSSRFAHMPKSDYLGHIETIRDDALVEQWKDSLRRKTVYRLKTSAPPAPKAADEAGATLAPVAAAASEKPAASAEAAAVPEAEASATEAAPAMTRREAQEWMRSKVNGMLRESARCMVPGPQSRTFDDPALRREVSMAWQRETRFPFTLSLALRPAFRHMRLHLFKVNAKETYVTAIAPTPVDLASAPEIVKEIVAFLEAHPGSTRQQVLEGVRPGANPEQKDAAEVLLHLGNLISNGGVIEFFNATLALPRRTPAPEGGEKKASKPAGTGADATEIPSAGSSPAGGTPEETAADGTAVATASEEEATPEESAVREEAVAPDVLLAVEPAAAESQPAAAPTETEAAPPSRAESLNPEDAEAAEKKREGTDQPE